MSMFQYTVEIADASSGRFVEQLPWVEREALYSQFPASLLTQLGYEADTVVSFRLADGSSVDGRIGDVHLRIGNEVRTVTCVFGDAADETLLGATTLEGFRLSADPVNKTLVPTVPLMLTMIPADALT